MAHLIGVHHEGHNLMFGVIPMGNFPLEPSADFLRHLATFPKGTRVGIESLSEPDFSEVKEDLSRLNWKHYNTLSKGDRGLPAYSPHTEDYWNALADYCLSAGLDPVFLEDKSMWFRFNMALVRQARVDARIHEDILFVKPGESDRDYHRKLCRCNDVRLGAEIRARRIHEIERDAKLLEVIAKSGVDIAVVGDGHAAAWFDDGDTIGRKYGIKFEDYSTDTIGDPALGSFHMRFARNATPDQRVVIDNFSLERALRLMGTGRVISKPEPDYVGVWDWVEPHRGYFEVFVDKKENGVLSGTIQDCLGFSTFRGRIDCDGTDFVKKYVRGGTGAYTQDVRYYSRGDGNEFYGYYWTSNGGSIFYMKKSKQETPLDCCMNLFDSFSTRKEDFERMVAELRGEVLAGK